MNVRNVIVLPPTKSKMLPKLGTLWPTNKIRPTMAVLNKQRFQLNSESSKSDMMDSCTFLISFRETVCKRGISIFVQDKTKTKSRPLLIFSARLLTTSSECKALQSV